MQLPPEIWGAVFRELDCRSLLCCRQVCKHFSKIVDISSALQYLIELAAADLQQIPSPDSTASLLNILKNHQSAWKDLQWKSTSEISLDDLHTWELAGDIFAYQTNDNTLVFNHLPAYYRGQLPEKRWSFKLDLPVSDFTIDPSQDLLVVCSMSQKFCVVHFLSISSGEKHPRAALPSISISISSEPTVYTARVHLEIRVYGCHVGVMLDYFSNDDLYIINWVSGQTKPLNPGIAGDLHSYAFMTEQLLLVAITEFNFTANWNLAQCSPLLRIFDISSVDNKHLCDFMLPKPSDGIDVDLTIYHQTAPSSLRAAPFSTNYDDVLFAIKYSPHVVHARSFTVFFLRSALLKHLEREDLTSDGSLAWRHWCTSGVHVEQLSFDDVWVCTIHGLRAVAHAGSQLKVFDFNQLGLRRGGSQPIDTFTESVRNLPLCEPIGKTSLLFSISTREAPQLPTDMEALMLCEDAIIIVTDTLNVFSF